MKKIILIFLMIVFSLVLVYAASMIISPDMHNHIKIINEKGFLDLKYSDEICIKKSCSYHVYSNGQLLETRTYINKTTQESDIKKFLSSLAVTPDLSQEHKNELK